MSAKSDIERLKKLISAYNAAEKEQAELVKLYEALNGNALLVLSAITSAPHAEEIASVQCPGVLNNLEAAVINALANAITDSTNKLVALQKELKGASEAIS